MRSHAAVAAGDGVAAQPMTPRTPRAVRRPAWPFRRLAVVLSGGGALGAYEVGVLKVLGAVGIVPDIVIGLSVGAINAVVWTAHGFDTAALERAWSRIGPASIGMRWTSLALRLSGLLVALLAAVEIVLSVMGSPELSIGNLLSRHPGASDAESAFYDVVAWMLLGAAGFALARGAREVEGRLAGLTGRMTPRRWQRWGGVAVLTGAALHLMAWLFGLPWLHRFGATVLVLGGLVWLLNRRGPAGGWMRRLTLKLLPEAGGGGGWGGGSRPRGRAPAPPPA